MADPFDAMLAGSTKSGRRRVTAAPTSTNTAPPVGSGAASTSEESVLADPHPAKAVMVRRGPAAGRVRTGHPSRGAEPASGAAITTAVPPEVFTPPVPASEVIPVTSAASTADVDLQRALAAAAALTAADATNEPARKLRRRWPITKTATMPAAVDDEMTEVDDPAEPAPTRLDKAAAKAEKRQQRRQAKSARVEFAAALGGSRGIQRAVRWTVGLVALMILLVGAITIAKPVDKPISAADVERAVSSQLSGSGFPAQAAEAFAARFASAYYTWASTDPQGQRAGVLAAYMPSTVGDGWDGHGAQKVVAGPFVSQQTVSPDGKTAIVHLSLQLDSGAWLFPDVSIYSDGVGGLVVAATPILGTPPGRAAYPGTSGSLPTPDNEDSASADQASVQQVLAGFLPAWAASDGAALDRYLTQDATQAARAGLGGAVTFKAVSGVELSAPVAGQTVRQVIASVTWTVSSSQPTAADTTITTQAQPDPASVTQTYLVTMVQSQGLWSVKDIAPGSTQADADNNIPGGGSAPATITPGGQPAGVVLPTQTNATPIPTSATSQISSAAPTTTKSSAASAPVAAPKTVAPRTKAPAPTSSTVSFHPAGPKLPAATSAPSSPPSRSTSR